MKTKPLISILATLIYISTVPASATSDHCLELFREPPSAGSIVKTSVTKSQLFNALEHLAMESGGTDLEWVLSSQTISALKAGRHLTDLITPEAQASTAQAFTDADAQAEPFQVEWHSSANPANMVAQNELSVFRGGIFFDGYFFKNGLEHKNNTKALTRNQPWLEYDFANHKFIAHQHGAQEALVRRWLDSVPGDTLTIYRGLTEERELGLMQIEQELANAQPVAAERLVQQFEIWKKEIAYDDPNKADAFGQTFKQQFNALALKIKSASPSQFPIFAHELSILIRAASTSLGRDAIFTSPLIEVGKKWGQQGLVAVNVPKLLLQEFSQTGEIFVGIEDKLEVALISERAQEMFRQQFFLPIKDFRWKSPRAD